MQHFFGNGVQFSYITAGQTLDQSDAVVVWAHGWGQSHQSFEALITPLATKAHHIALDFPGFGNAEPPPENWGTAEYADAVADWLDHENLPPVLWVGHSFGCRVGLQLAARAPKRIKAMTFIAGAGLKRKRPPHKRLYFFFRIRLFKLLRRLVPDGSFKTKLMAKFGSADYNNAGPLRKIFIRVVNEDLSEQAQNISCPVTLVYGQNDTETPPEFGTRYSRLIRDAKLFLLEGQDHYSVLQNGRHPVIKILNDFITENKQETD